MDANVLTKSTSMTQLLHRITFSTDEEVTRSSDHEHAPEKKSHKFRGNGFHYRKISDDSHGFLKKRADFGSQEFKEKDIHASSVPRSKSHGFLPGLIKRAGFGSQEFKDFLVHAAKDLTEIHHHHQPHNHYHGTWDKKIFGFEDAGVQDRDHNIFGMRDMELHERDGPLFGFEDTEFDSREKGRDLFGGDNPDTLSFLRGLEILGSGCGGD